MNEQKRRTALFAGGVAVLLVAACYMLFFRGGDDSIPTVSGKGLYYTGPMKSKGGGEGYGTLDGKAMTGEEGKAAAQEWLKSNPNLKTEAPPSSDQTSNNGLAVQ